MPTAKEPKDLLTINFIFPQYSFMRRVIGNGYIINPIVGISEKTPQAEFFPHVLADRSVLRMCMGEGWGECHALWTPRVRLFLSFMGF